MLYPKPVGCLEVLFETPRREAPTRKSASTAPASGGVKVSR